MVAVEETAMKKESLGTGRTRTIVWALTSKNTARCACICENPALNRERGEHLTRTRSAGIRMHWKTNEEILSVYCLTFGHSILVCRRRRSRSKRSHRPRSEEEVFWRISKNQDLY